ncbi:MAG: hypothetical protein GVY36_13830 [Verrucomicrobia bacterium]|nr:hypothetical protein [Verrucomicrobiota bacterium]
MVSIEVDGERTGHPFARQAARVRRERVNRKPQSFCLLTSRPRRELGAGQWLEKNIDHWGIETGLHARLDASRHDDTCRLRNPRPLHLHAIFSRVANSICCHWLFAKKKPDNFTTSDFQSHMGEEHDRRNIALVTARKPKL